MMDASLLIGAVTAIFGALLGVGIRRLTKFLYPTDFISLGLYALLLMFIILIPMFNVILSLTIWTPPISVEQYGAFIIGYIFGYWVDGKMAFTMVRTRVLRTKYYWGEPWITYYHYDMICVAVQTNKALWGRLFKDNHVPILSNAPFFPDWTEGTKYPLFPIFKASTIFLESNRLIRVKPTADDVGRRRPPKRYAMKVEIAHGSMVSAEQLCYEADAVAMANEALGIANRRLIMFSHYVKTVVPRILTNFIADTYRKAPAMAFVEALDDTHERFMVTDEEEEEEQPTEESDTNETDQNGQGSGQES